MAKFVIFGKAFADVHGSFFCASDSKEQSFIKDSVVPATQEAAQSPLWILLPPLGINSRKHI